MSYYWIAYINREMQDRWEAHGPYAALATAQADLWHDREWYSHRGGRIVQAQTRAAAAAKGPRLSPTG